MVSGKVGTHLKIRAYYSMATHFCELQPNAHAPIETYIHIHIYVCTRMYTTSADIQFRYSMFVFAVTPPESTREIGWVSDYERWVRNSW